MSSSEDGDSFYEDDFEDESVKTSNKARKKVVSQHSNSSDLRSKVSSQLSHNEPSNKVGTSSSKKNPYLTSVRNRQRNNNQTKIVVQRRFSPSQLDAASQRILSSRQHKIDEQQNIIQDLKNQIEMMRSENRTIKMQSLRQEKALMKIENKQSDLPKILENHSAEIDNLKEQLKRTKESVQTESKGRQDAIARVNKLEKSLKEARNLINSKGLMERNDLQNSLQATTEKLETSETNLQNITRHMENTEKSHKREVNSLKRQLKTHSQTIEELTAEIEKLKANIKEKEKLLEIQNIYSHRIKIPLFKLPEDTQSQNAERNNETYIQKLDFSEYTNKDQNRDTEEPKSETPYTYFTEEKIKEDIRKILEEEIKSGRIKPLLQDDDNSETKSIVMQSFIIDHESKSPQRTSNLINEPEIMDNLTQNETQDETQEETNDETQDDEKPTTSNESVNNLQNTNSDEENFPEPVQNEKSIENIEESQMSSIKHKTTHQFNDVIENLHSGRPITYQSSISHQHNNSNRKNHVIDETTLPPLNEEERQRRERELMSELFGNSYSPQPVVHGRPYPSGSAQKRATSLPWEGEEETIDRSPNKNIRQPSIDTARSDDLEEIVI